MINKLFPLIFASLFIVGCSEKIPNIETETPTIRDSIKLVEQPLKIIKESSEVLPGIDVLVNDNFKTLMNKRVGLITNQTGVNKNLESTIDLLYKAPNVNLVALYGPEHGVRGDVEGGKYIEFYIDKKTQLPVYSLYGKTRKPSSEMLQNIDILVYDIQDIGVRSYTFISTMGLAIEAASENNIEFLILDRPNPLGGKKVEGNIVEDDFISFISLFKIPYVYGLTCGELASYLVGEGIINTSKDFKVEISKLENWKRDMIWKDTGLEWIPTSPHIPHSFSPFFYPMTGILGELRSAISIGVGYTLPFQIVGTEWIEPEIFANHLNKMNIPGLKFRPIVFKPYYAFGKGKSLKGAQIHIVDYKKVNLTNTQFYILSALRDLYPENNIFELASKNELGMFNKGIGTNKIYKFFITDQPLYKILKFLDKDILEFKNKSKKYYLY